MKTNLIVFALLGVLAVGCASHSDNDPNSPALYGNSSAPPNADDRSLKQDIKDGHDRNTSGAVPPSNGGAPGSISGPGATPQP